MLIHANMLAISKVPALTALFVISCGTIIGTALMFIQYGNKQLDVERRLHLQSWHLRQLVSNGD